MQKTESNPSETIAVPSLEMPWTEFERTGSITAALSFLATFAPEDLPEA